MNALWEARAASPLHLVESDQRVPLGATGMPADIGLEETVLGSILISEQVLSVLTADEGLSVECFYRGWHRQVFGAMLALHAAGEPVDAVTVRQQLTKTGTSLEQAERVEMLTGAVANLGNVRAYGRRLVELAGWRMVKHAGIELVASADSQDAIRRGHAEGLLGKPSRHAGSQDGQQLASMLFDHLNGESAVRSVPLAFHGLVSPMAGGLREGEATLLGGWTSHGKSACLDTILTHASREGQRVHLYINEMTVRIRSMRILSAEARVPLSRLLNRGTLRPEDAERATRILKTGMPFGITDVAGWTAEEIARDIRLRGWDLVGVDILHLIPHKDVADLDAVSSALTLAAKSSGAHVIATAHLNEERAKTAKLPVPVLRDLRGSGMLKNNSDNVLFIHRDQEVDDRQIVSLLDTGSISIAKCRNGALGAIGVEFEGRFVRYREVAR